MPSNMTSLCATQVRHSSTTASAHLLWSIFPVLALTAPNCTLRRPDTLRHSRAKAARQRSQSFSVLSRPPSQYPGHIPLNLPERVALTIGSAALAYLDPTRHDLVATLSETTSTPTLRALRSSLLRSPTGRLLLRHRPRISSATLSLDHLRTLPPNSLGATYAAWLTRNKVTPDTRAPVRHIDDPELAYILQRYRESHDFFHAVTDLPIVREGEVALKAFEFAALGLPMAGLSVFAVTGLKREERSRFWGTYGPWAFRNGEEVGVRLLSVPWERWLERDVWEVRRELGVVLPPDLREERRKAREARKRRVEEGDIGVS